MINRDKLLHRSDSTIVYSRLRCELRAIGGLDEDLKDRKNISNETE